MTDATTCSAAVPSPSRSSLRALAPYWQVTFASFLGWFLDAFDQTTLMFTLPDIAHDLGCTIADLGAVLMGQSIGRALGNTGWGWLADRYGRKPAFMLGVVWFAVFSAMTGLTHHFYVLMAIQFMFGIGFGGEWTASAALLMESVPAWTRPMASSLMMSGYEVGYFAAAGVQALVLPHYGWRVLFFIGLAPTLLALFIRIGVPESPVWLRNREARLAQRHEPRAPAKLRPRFKLTGAAFQAIAFMGFLEFQKAAIYTYYPTILRGSHHLSQQAVFWPVTLYCAGSFGGKVLCGWLAERFGEVRVMLSALIVVMLTIWPFLSAPGWNTLLIAAFVMGGAASGIFALVPHYLAQRFPSDTRSFGMGLGYALGSIGQGMAQKFVPMFGPTALTLPLSAEIFVLTTSVVTGAIALIRPKELPGEHMEGDETAS
ncbi:MFS transporter [Gluconobacter kanchanaburiensis]|uniref:MFS transporter n=1 Tax=Gluconobacter kanchanaburiensis NBRC 103587 TaxID=1307948 RepID=A0A511B553_9PROT|nr:MFS transporter [Gluconobacter kanchanaburiensis]MBF0860988.1 MFS transporter [Gluconobacter kanchanaburiensis]GBR70170.1 sugar transport protein [Gluconobacter kanchanaburiensis NBRC 103587]GEK94833.1 MFS transporter [Gluconobacter kanchanaburiensis NBRC 103587]